MRTFFLVVLFCFCAGLAQGRKSKSIWFDLANWKCANDTAKYKGVVMGYFINDTTIVDSGCNIIGYLLPNGKRADKKHRYIGKSDSANRSVEIYHFLAEPQWDREWDKMWKEWKEENKSSS